MTLAQCDYATLIAIRKRAIVEGNTRLVKQVDDILCKAVESYGEMVGHDRY